MNQSSDEEKMTAMKAAAAAVPPEKAADRPVQKVFERREIKYLISRQQFERLYDQLLEYMDPDRYGRSTVCSVYYDNERSELIMKSIDKPQYKEKFRVRSYGVPGPESPVFAEIKKKYMGVVYKRRVTAPYEQIRAFLDTGQMLPKDIQIQKEILYMIERYQLRPSVYIAYDRLALAGKDDPEVRVTFDFNTRYRTRQLDLAAGDYGDPLRGGDFYIMEIKLGRNAPLWLSRILTGERIFRGSFSKYGTYYKEHVLGIRRSPGTMRQDSGRPEQMFETDIQEGKHA